MDEYWGEFAKVALAHALAVASPGPDFSIVLRQSLRHGRRTAVWTSLGIGAGISLHVGYSLLGIGLVIAGSETWFAALKYLGAGYLAWLGVRSLRARRREAEAIEAGRGGSEEPGGRAAFATGFLTNALNPKATLFFVALFATVIRADTPKIVQAAYGGWMVLATAAWFCAVAVVFAREPLRRAFWWHGHWIDRALGVVFLGFAASLLAMRVAGPFYVDATCIDCDQCRVMAPDIFGRDEDTGMSFVKRQPATEEENSLVEQAMSECATSSIGDDGA